MSAVSASPRSNHATTQLRTAPGPASGHRRSRRFTARRNVSDARNAIKAQDRRWQVIGESADAAVLTGRGTMCRPPHDALLPRSGRGYQPVVGRLRASSIATRKSRPGARHRPEAVATAFREPSAEASSSRSAASGCPPPPTATHPPALCPHATPHLRTVDNGIRPGAATSAWRAGLHGVSAAPGPLVHGSLSGPTETSRAASAPHRCWMTSRGPRKAGCSVVAMDDAAVPPTLGLYGASMASNEAGQLSRVVRRTASASELTAASSRGDPR